MRQIPSDEVKNDLLQSGKWVRFIEVFQAMKKAGMTNCQKKALKEVAPEIVDKYSIGHGGGYLKLPMSVTKEEADRYQLSGVKVAGEKFKDRFSKPPKVVRELDEVMDDLKKDKIVESSVKPEPVVDSPVADGSIFKDKTCSMTDAILWAYEKSAMSGVKPAEAPSAIAWCLLQDFKKYLAYKQDLFKGVALAITKKEEAQDEYGGDSFDGKVEYDILQRLGGSEARVGEVSE